MEDETLGRLTISQNTSVTHHENIKCVYSSPQSQLFFENVSFRRPSVPKELFSPQSSSKTTSQGGKDRYYYISSISHVKNSTQKVQDIFPSSELLTNRTRLPLPLWMSATVPKSRHWVTSESLALGPELQLLWAGSSTVPWGSATVTPVLVPGQAVIPEVSKSHCQVHTVGPW